jgi:hypothetical protein
MRDGVLVAAALAIGWWAHSGVAVQANSSSHASGELSFQFMKNDINNSLTIYDAGEHVLYVYQGASSLGASKINCSYMFHIANAGAPIQRENCRVN